MSFIKNVFNQATNKLTYKVNELTYDPNAEAAALQRKAAVQPGSTATNESNFNAYKAQWGARATASGMIDPKYFKTYESILAIPAPPADANRETFDSATTSLAGAIKAWYVGAKYKGNLNELSFTIDATKPKYIPPPGVNVAVKPVKPPTATQQFMKGFLGTLMSTIAALFLVFICLLAGSLAANDAIGRSPFMRFIAFVYSAIPFYTPFVLIYYVYRYFKGTYPMFYNFMPLTTYTSTNWLVGTLLWPFYYIEDANAQFQKAEYDRLGGLLVWMREPKTAESAAAASAEAERLSSIKRAGLDPATEKAMLGRVNSENQIPNNNGRMNNENQITNNNGRMNNELALNMVAKAINSEPKPASAPTN
jgi:hypothetical protein